jgi:hypothetical protein
MALNFNLLNPDLPEQIAGSFQQGYQGAQDRANVLEQREQQKRDRVARIIQDGAKAIVATPGAYKSVFARVNKVTGVPLDDDERRYDEAFATGGEDAVKKLAMADANFDIETVLSLRDREAYEAYLKGQQPATMPSAMPSAAPTVAQNVDLNKYPPVNPLITSIGLSQPKAQRVTNALDPSIIERVGLSPQTTNALAPTPTAQAPAAPVNALVSAPVDPRAAIRNEIAQLLNFKDPRAAVRIRQLEQQLTAMEPRVVGGSVYYPDTGEFKTPTRPSSKLISVLVNGQPTLVPEEQAVGMTPATAQTMRRMGAGAAPSAGGARAGVPKAEAGVAAPFLTRKEMEKREAALPKATQAVKIVGNTMSTIEQTVDRLINNPEGLNGITGLIYGRTPGITDAARQAEADLNQLKNLAFVQGLTELREASKTGAGVGNVSNKEGERFENLKASLDRTQSFESLSQALLRLKAQAQFTKQSLQEAFDDTYQYRSGQATAAPSATKATAPNIDALLEKYK